MRPEMCPPADWWGKPELSSFIREGDDRVEFIFRHSLMSRHRCRSLTNVHVLAGWCGGGSQWVWVGCWWGPPSVCWVVRLSLSCSPQNHAHCQWLVLLWAGIAVLKASTVVYKTTLLGRHNWIITTMLLDKVVTDPQLDFICSVLRRLNHQQGTWEDTSLAQQEVWGAQELHFDPVRRMRGQG